VTLHELTQRLTRHVASIGRRYPHAWEQMAQFRAAKGSKELGDWPAWCWVPLAGAYAVASGGHTLTATDPAAGDIGAVGALAAWRQTQGIYTVDETLLEALWDTELSGEIPVDVLYRLPEWCVYVPTPGRAVGALPLVGFFAHLEHDMGDGRTELRLLLDTDSAPGPALVAVPLHVWMPGGLAAAAQRAREEAEFQARAHGMEPPGGSFAAFEQAGRDCAPLVSVVLYLCSTAAEIRDRSGTARRQHRPREARAANAPTVWETGYAIGPALRMALSRARDAPPDGGTHASPRPHIRRAHWHAFWTGPHDTPERKIELRWLPPIPVALERGEVVPTVRRV
jgi:hypothetical protein